jgi:hypothetical protein
MQCRPIRTSWSCGLQVYQVARRVRSPQQRRVHLKQGFMHYAMQICFLCTLHNMNKLRLCSFYGGSYRYDKSLAGVLCYGVVRWSACRLNTYHHDGDQTAPIAWTGFLETLGRGFKLVLYATRLTLRKNAFFRGPEHSMEGRGVSQGKFASGLQSVHFLISCKDALPDYATKALKTVNSQHLYWKENLEHLHDSCSLTSLLRHHSCAAIVDDRRSQSNR